MAELNHAPFGPTSPEDHTRRVGLRIRLQTHAMEPKTGIHLYLRALLLHITWPNGGFVWQTPVDVRVEAATGTQRLWLPDWTRLALLGIGLLTMMVLWRSKST